VGGLLEGLAGEVVVLDVARDPGAEGHADEVDQGGSGGAVGDGAAGRVRAEPVAEQGRRRVVELVVLGLVVVLVLELVGLIEALVGELHGAGCAALGGGAHRSPPSPARGPDLGLPGPVIVWQVHRLRAAGQTELAAAKASRLPALTTRANALPAGSPAWAALSDLQVQVAVTSHQAATITTADRYVSVTTPAAGNKASTANQPALRALRADRNMPAADRRQNPKTLRAARRAAGTTPAG